VSNSDAARNRIWKKQLENLLEVSLRNPVTFVKSFSSPMGPNNNSKSLSQFVLAARGLVAHWLATHLVTIAAKSGIFCGHCCKIEKGTSQVQKSQISKDRGTKSAFSFGEFYFPQKVLSILLTSTSDCLLRSFLFLTLMPWDVFYQNKCPTIFPLPSTPPRCC